MIQSEHFVLSRHSGFEFSDKPSVAGITLEAVAKDALRRAESQRIISALKETKGNKSRAAEILQVSYKTLLTKIKDYGIEA
jgi:DNA-binding NtrC family response regulator